MPHVPFPSTLPSRYVSIAEAAQRASVNRDTVRRMIADGQLPAYRFRGHVRIAVEDIDKDARPSAESGMPIRTIARKLHQRTPNCRKP